MVKYRSLEKILSEGGVTEKPHWKEGREHFLQIAERYKEGEPTDFPSGGVSPSLQLSYDNVGLEYSLEPSNLTLQSHFQVGINFLL